MHSERMQERLSVGSSINRIKNAFVVVLLRMYNELLGSVVASAAPSVEADPALGQPALGKTGIRVFGVAVLHVHDEAALRLRSHLGDVPKQASRSRSSKVQQHVVTVCVAGKLYEVPTEMDVLANKTAKVIATSLDRVNRAIADTVAGSLFEGTENWYVHILVGDGIGTNEAAAKVLVAENTRLPVGGGKLLYLLMVIKCATHQASLATKGAVVGRAAMIGEDDRAATGATKLADKGAYHHLTTSLPPADATEALLQS